MENITTIAFAGAFLRWQDEVILLKRGLHKKLGPGMWAGVGGHIEQSETYSPITACYREIEEETGILPPQISELNLRYFALLKRSSELHSIYYFSGILNEKLTLCETTEGQLHWVNIKDGLELQMSAHTKAIEKL